MRRDKYTEYKVVMIHPSSSAAAAAAAAAGGEEEVDVVWRRFSDFYDFHSRMKKLIPSVKKLSIPSKTLTRRTKHSGACSSLVCVAWCGVWVA